MMELKQWMSLSDLFAAENQVEKVCLMRQAWDMGKDPLVIMRSSPHAVSCCPLPQVDVMLYADSETLGIRYPDITLLLPESMEDCSCISQIPL
jgi:hypothetical protein